MHNNLMIPVRKLVLALALALPGTLLAQTSFPRAEDAANALQRALQANDDQALIALFGEKYRSVIGTGDRSYDTARRTEAAQAMATRKRLEELGPDRRILRMGAQDWPFAIPIVRDPSGMAWRFATEEGVEELANRRVGFNERNAIHVLRALVDAQKEYAEKDRMGDGVLQYARKLGSSPGKKDGLYWDADPAKGDEPSPLGPLVAAASTELKGHKEGEPYAGYHFRMLTRQGPGAPGGAYSYVINGRMVAGFAAVAYPADYGRSGVMTFIVNQSGKVYEKNLGPKAAAVTTFDPAGWTEVKPEH